MTSDIKSEVAEIYSKAGVVTLSMKETPFSADEWEQMDTITLQNRSLFKYVDSADTEESTSVWVLPLLRNAVPPVLVNRSVSRPLLGIIGGQAKVTFYENILGCGPLTIRRSQLHLMTSGTHIGRHVDSESSPDYVAAIVLQFEAAVTGGEFVVFDRVGTEQVLRSFSMAITDADLPHEVKRVYAGNRRSLVYWLSLAK